MSARLCCFYTSFHHWENSTPAVPVRFNPAAVHASLKRLWQIWSFMETTESSFGVFYSKTRVQKGFTGFRQKQEPSLAIRGKWCSSKSGRFLLADVVDREGWSHVLRNSVAAFFFVSLPLRDRHEKLIQREAAAILEWKTRNPWQITPDICCLPERPSR